MSKQVVILGAGGFAREVADIFRDMGPDSEYEFLGFVDGDSSHKGELLNDSEVIGSILDLGATEHIHAVVGSGQAAIRDRQIAEIETSGMHALTVVHPSVTMSPFVSIGDGTVICAGTILTNSITVGRFVVLNLGVTVGHDVTIGDRCVVSPGVHISGEVEIGSGCSLGTGAVILPRLSVGDGAVVGAGAVVTRNVGAGETVVGIPAKPLRRRT